MFEHNIKIRVRYAETDRMGFVYYGNYATYLEVARVETLRKLGVSYKDLEDKGILLPVVNYNIDYKSPAHYDDHLEIQTVITELPSVKIKFDYKIYRETTLISEAETTLVFLDTEKQRPVRCPEEISAALSQYF